MADTTWNEIPYGATTPQQMADEFDAQLRENGGDPSVTLQSAVIVTDENG